MSPSPDTHDSNSSTSVVVASSSPQKPAERVVAGVAMDAAVGTAAVVVTVENPYLAGLGKKTRGLKKKLEKIKKTESLSASGKVWGGAVGQCLYLFICLCQCGRGSSPWFYTST